MTLAEMHIRLDRLEALIEEEIDVEKTESARRLDRLRGLKNQTASMRVAITMARDELSGAGASVTRASVTREAA